MTEGSDDGKNLVRVRAQVMMRDDSTGGWVPMGGGGLSNVSVRKRNIQPDLHDHRQEYLIYGKRISDQTVVLSCTIKKDFEYNKVMPTFHHWRTGDHKFGLTFQTAADAREFDRGVRLAVDELLDGEFSWRRGGHSACGTHSSGVTRAGGSRRYIPPFQAGTSRNFISRGVDPPSTIYDLSEGLTEFPPSYPYGSSSDVEAVFMTVDLPMEIDGSRSSSGSVTTSSSSRHTPTTTPDHPSHPLHQTQNDPHHYTHHHHYLPPYINSLVGGGGVACPTNTSPSTIATTAGSTTSKSYTHSHANHHKITYAPRPAKSVSPHSKSQDKLSDIDCDGKLDSQLGSSVDSDKIDSSGGESYPYLEFLERPVPTVSQNEYHYPGIEGKRDSIASIKKELVGDTQAPEVPPIKQCNLNNRNKREKCCHCQYSFTEESNSRGSCKYAPDSTRTFINCFTCITCAHCMLYHCMSDAEGDFAHNPCNCDGVVVPPSEESCSRRWLGLTFLSLVVPCLWCYPPLRACHRCAVACGICGGKHQAS